MCTHDILSVSHRTVFSVPSSLDIQGKDYKYQASSFLDAKPCSLSGGDNTEENLAFKPGEQESYSTVVEPHGCATGAPCVHAITFSSTHVEREGVSQNHKCKSPRESSVQMMSTEEKTLEVFDHQIHQKLATDVIEVSFDAQWYEAFRYGHGKSVGCVIPELRGFTITNANPNESSVWMHSDLLSKEDV